MLCNYTAKYIKISLGYMGQLVEWPEIVTEGKSLEEWRYCQMLWMSNFTYPPESHYAATSSTSSPSTNFLFSSTRSIS